MQGAAYKQTYTFNMLIFIYIQINNYFKMDIYIHIYIFADWVIFLGIPENM